MTNLVPRPASAPTGLLATPGVGQVSFNWSSVPGATGYNLKRATVRGGPYDAITPTLSTTSFVDNGLIAGTFYYYVVSAVNLGGEGPDSAEVLATSAPPMLSIALTGGTVYCSWPTSAATFSLQESSVAVGGWTNSAATLQVQGTDNVAMVSNGDQAKYYRLAQ